MSAQDKNKHNGHYGRRPRIFAWLLIAIGFIGLSEKIFHVDVWEKYWPLFLILLGVIFLLGPRGPRKQT